MIIALEDAKYKLTNFDDKLSELASALRIDELKVQVAEMEKETLGADFWSNAENSAKVLRNIKQLKSKIENYEKLAQKVEDTLVLTEMAIEENDEGLVDEIVSEVKEIEKEDTSEPTMGNIQTVYAGLTYGRHSLNESVAASSMNRGYKA